MAVPAHCVPEMFISVEHTEVVPDAVALMPHHAFFLMNLEVHRLGRHSLLGISDGAEDGEHQNENQLFHCIYFFVICS